MVWNLRQENSWLLWTFERPRQDVCQNRCVGTGSTSPVIVRKLRVRWFILLYNCQYGACNFRNATTLVFVIRSHVLQLRALDLDYIHQNDNGVDWEGLLITCKENWGIKCCWSAVVNECTALLRLGLANCNNYACHGLYVVTVLHYLIPGNYGYSICWILRIAYSSPVYSLTRM